MILKKQWMLTMLLSSGKLQAFAFVSGLFPFLILHNQNNLDTTAIVRTFG
ncbi:hypothetical protein PCCS19_12060 [Paenibacillus sp. CCS19]|nr:hypothetical protein [Paenibacillus cellulosilyticus]GMK38152.1 hypothetical protein PCCS19_12060 [Paenibacillus cellulosilyticus]